LGAEGPARSDAAALGAMAPPMLGNVPAPARGPSHPAPRPCGKPEWAMTGLRLTERERWCECFGLSLLPPPPLSDGHALAGLGLLPGAASSRCGADETSEDSAASVTRAAHQSVGSAVALAGSRPSMTSDALPPAKARDSPVLLVSGMLLQARRDTAPPPRSAEG
jgi:hypothetical protein